MYKSHHTITITIFFDLISMIFCLRHTSLLRYLRFLPIDKILFYFRLTDPITKKLLTNIYDVGKLKTHKLLK
jgi:hypothetical protein